VEDFIAKNKWERNSSRFFGAMSVNALLSKKQFCKPVAVELLLIDALIYPSVSGVERNSFSINRNLLEIIT
jgi:hypothetical protein